MCASTARRVLAVEGSWTAEPTGAFAAVSGCLVQSFRVFFCLTAQPPCRLFRCFRHGDAAFLAVAVHHLTRATGAWTRSHRSP
jgi:hypothetical protein